MTTTNTDAVARLRALLDAQVQYDRGVIAEWQTKVESALVGLCGEDAPPVIRFRQVSLPVAEITAIDWVDQRFSFETRVDEAKGIIKAAIETVTDASAQKAVRGPSMDPSMLTLGDLARRLTAKQAYALLTTVVTLLVGAFALGTWLTSYRVDRTATKLDEALETRDRAISLLEQARVKEQFFSAYLRYLAAQQDLQFSYTPEVQERVHTSERAFAQLISGWMKKEHESPSAPRVHFTPRIHKGEDVNNSRIQFADGTIWAIPGEVKRVVLQLQNPVRIP
jgi:hypothetical protein